MKSCRCTLGQSNHSLCFVTVLFVTVAAASLNQRSEPLRQRPAFLVSTTRMTAPATPALAAASVDETSQLAALDQQLVVWTAARRQQTSRQHQQPALEQLIKQAVATNTNNNPGDNDTDNTEDLSSSVVQQTLRIGQKMVSGHNNKPQRLAKQSLAIPPNNTSITGRYTYYRANDILAPLATPLLAGSKSAWQARYAADRPQDREIERQLQQALSYGFDRVQHCWQQVQLTNTSTSGTMTLALTLNRLGYVERVTTLQDSMRNSELNKCIYAAAKRIRTATAAGERIFIELPLQFSSPS